MEHRHRDALRRIYQAEQIWTNQGKQPRSFMLMHLGGMRSEIDHPAWDSSWAVPSEHTIDDLAELHLLRVDPTDNKARTFALTMKGREHGAALVAPLPSPATVPTVGNEPVPTSAATTAPSPLRSQSVSGGGSGPTAFITWAHEDPAWEKTIAEFAFKLRTLGIDANIDLFELHNPSVNWATYGPNAITNNDFVIIAASRAYKERWDGTNNPAVGAGAAREANVLKAMFNEDQSAFYRKVKIVVLPGITKDDIPAELIAAPQHFEIDSVTDADLEDLLRTLTDQPAFPRPAVGSVPILPPKFIDTASSETETSLPRPEDIPAELQDRLLELEQRLNKLSTAERGARANLTAERTTVEAALGALSSAAKSGTSPALMASSAHEPGPDATSEPVAIPVTIMTTGDATLIALARVLIDKGDLASAELHLTRVAAHGNGHGMLLLGMLLHETNRNEEAVSMLRASVAAGRREALTPLGLVLHALGRLDEAESVLAEASAQKPATQVPSIGEIDLSRPTIFSNTRDLLRHLQQEGAQTERQLEECLGDIDQIGNAEIAEWAKWAEQNNIIESTTGSTAVRRWNITDKGQTYIGPPDS
jgi:hypothetical protein